MTEKNQGGYLAVSFKSYLAALKAKELAKSGNERRPVPSANQVGKMAGLSQSATSRLTGGKAKSLPIKRVCAMLNVMNNLGFDTQITDFLTYKFEKKDKKQNKN